MLRGCSGFVTASLMGYALSVWPFFAFQEAEKLSQLITASASGLIPAAIFGTIAARRFGLAGACGFVAGSISTAIFLYLRLNQAVLAGMAQQAPVPEWPGEFVTLLPLGYVLLAVFLAILAMPRNEAEL